MLSGGDYTAEAEAGVGAADRRAAWPRPWAEWDDGHPPAAAAGVAAGPREARRTAAEVCSPRRSGARDSRHWDGAGSLTLWGGEKTGKSYRIRGYLRLSHV